MLWVQIPGNTHTDKKCIACKSLWIKVSAKCVNHNYLVEAIFGIISFLNSFFLHFQKSCFLLCYLVFIVYYCVT